MRLRHLPLLLAALLAAVPAALAGGGRREKAYQSPQEVFDAAKQAAAQQKWKEFCDCLTNESRDVFAGVLALAGSQMESQALAAATKAKDEESKAFVRKLIKGVLQPVTEVYNKHGLTEQVLSKMDASKLFGLDKDNVNPEELKKALLNAAKPVKDKAAFIADVMKAMTKLMKAFGKGDEAMFDFFPKDARLDDLKVEGDTAKGMIVGMKRGLEMREPIHFKKDRRGWKVELPMDPFKGGPGAKKEESKKDARAPAPARMRSRAALGRRDKH